VGNYGLKGEVMVAVVVVEEEEEEESSVYERNFRSQH